eukprot:gene27530-33252_t
MCTLPSPQPVDSARLHRLQKTDEKSGDSRTDENKHANSSNQLSSSLSHVPMPIHTLSHISPIKHIQDQPTSVSTSSPLEAHSFSLAHVLFTSFTMVCVAELGDRSFFSLFTLTLQNHPEHCLYILFGGVAGQFVCTVIAYFCGDVIRRYLTEAMVSAIGGSSFLLFALWNAGQLMRREWKR